MDVEEKEGVKGYIYECSVDDVSGTWSERRVGLGGRAPLVER